MFFWKTQDNPWLAARSARKNPPILITMLLCFALFWGYMYAAYGLRELIFGGISALLSSLIESGAIENLEYAIYDDFNVIAYSFTFILLVPLGILYAKLVEGRSPRSFALHRDRFFRRFFLGFLIGTAVLAAVLGFLSIFRIFRVTGFGDFHWLSFLLGVICILILCFSEEYFFRGMVLSSFGARSHPLTAVFAAAVLSSVCNYFYFNNIREFNLFLIADHILLGCLLGILVYRTGNLITAVGVRTALVFLSQLVFGIPFSNYSYAHTILASKYTTASIWFTTDIIPGIDTGFGMFAILALALALAIFLPARGTGVEKPETKAYFRHVKTVPQPAAADPDPEAEARPSASCCSPSAPTENTDITPESSSGNMEEETWDEEVARAPVAPNYKAPEDYLKK